MSIGLLLAGSFSAMQSAVVLCGLPFSVILLLYMFGLAKALKQEETHKPHAEAQMTQTRASVQPAKETSSV